MKRNKSTSKKLICKFNFNSIDKARAYGHTLINRDHLSTTKVLFLDYSYLSMNFLFTKKKQKASCIRIQL